VKRWTFSIFALLALTACAPGLGRPDAPHYAVRPDCGGVPRCFTTIQAAIDASTAESKDAWVRIDIAPGTYVEKVTLRRPRTRLHGAGASRSIVRFGEVAQTAGRFHRDNWGTAGSATLTVDADEAIVDGLTIENTFDFLANDALADSDPRKMQNSQALAVLLDKHSDRVLIRDAELLGYQDTLFANGRRAIVRRSVVAGNVDFIFGNGQLLIEDSTIRTRPRAAQFKPGEFQSMITAPSTPSSQPVGIVIYRSRITREAGVPDGSVALGRPWHPTRNFPDGRYADPDAVGQASFIDCWLDAHIHPEHWTSMPGTARDGTKTHIFKPQDSRFFESGSRGPGARRVDIGLRWNAAPSIADVRRVIYENWPEAQRSR
jgi:pectinesterase